MKIKLSLLPSSGNCCRIFPLDTVPLPTVVSQKWWVVGRHTTIIDWSDLTLQEKKICYISLIIFHSGEITRKKTGAAGEGKVTISQIIELPTADELISFK